MSKGHHKQGGRRKKGDWLVIERGRANKHRAPRTTVRCPHVHGHLVQQHAFLAHLAGCTGRRQY